MIAHSNVKKVKVADISVENYDDPIIIDIVWKNQGTSDDTTQYGFDYTGKFKNGQIFKISLTRFSTLIDEETEDYSEYVEGSQEDCLILDYIYTL